MKGRILFWSLTSALAGFLFGFDTVVISGAEQKIQSLWGLSAGIHGIAMASALYGTVLGSLLGGWLALRLRDESADPNALEAQFALFREAERAKREKLLHQAEILKMAGTAVAVLLFIFALLVLIWFVRHRR